MLYVLLASFIASSIFLFSFQRDNHGRICVNLRQISRPPSHCGRRSPTSPSFPPHSLTLTAQEMGPSQTGHMSQLSMNSAMNVGSFMFHRKTQSDPDNFYIADLISQAKSTSE